MIRLRRLLAIAVAVVAPALHAQQLPTSDQAKRLLDTRPDLVSQLRREITTSGLTPDQIRARLRATGYPDDLLDAYLRPTRGARDSLTALAPNDDVLEAVAALGIVDSTDTSELRSVLRSRRMRDTSAQREARATTRRDTMLLDADSAQMIDTIAPLVTPARVRRLPAADSGATIFGLKVFDGATTQFDPNLAGPVDASYRLGAGDRLVLFITGDAERAYTLDVTREGFVVVPGIGQIAVANLTLAQLEDVLFPRLARVYSGLRRDGSGTTHASLNVARLHTNQIFVLGDVDQPGSYRVSSAGTALTALYAAGGPTPNGSFRRVEVRRGGRLVDTLDLYDYLLRADGSHDPRLLLGDVVFVPVRGAQARVWGEVVRPATYELRHGETLGDLLRAAGGFTAQAGRRRVQISRILPPNERDTTDRARVTIDVGAEQLASAGFPIEAGDVVRVFPVSERVGRRVTVRGDVWTPGVVGFTAGMRLSDAVRLAGGLKPDAYLGQLLVARLRGADSTRVQLRAAFDASTRRLTDDLALEEDDEIRVFSVTELRTPAYVAITGAVRKPGRFAYREGITMRDLVLLAGGLEDRAYLTEAEVAQLPSSRDGGRLAVTQRVPLDSSYLPGRAPLGSARPDVALQPFANVLILARPDWERPRRVVLTGEVRFPGTYTLLAKSDRLSDVITRAGGLTTSAYAGGVAFYRNGGRRGRVGVDLPRVLRDARASDNLLLQDGDSLDVPPYDGIVDVLGAVNAPRGVAYVRGASLDYYVRAAGGGTRAADLRRTYVTQPDGNVESIVVRRLRPDGAPVPKPGSVVYVVQRDATDHPDSVARLGVIAQVLGGLVALTAIIIRR
jgi:protein involved in polysaccharide export with SLBB domain